LGLAQVYGIIRQHEGYIEAQSKPSMGTRFTFYLPLLAVHEHEQTPKSSLRLAVGEGQTILVVEDDLATREGVRDVLEAMNYRVLVAVNGEDALRIFEFEGDDIDLVVTDLVMPGMGGMALYKSLRERKPDIRVVMMTGYPLGVSTRELLQHGEVVLVQKPLSSELLCNTVRDALQDNGDIHHSPDYIAELDGTDE
jgi:DNA-binding NtrC family response regulator